LFIQNKVLTTEVSELTRQLEFESQKCRTQEDACKQESAKLNSVLGQTRRDREFYKLFCFLPACLTVLIGLCFLIYRPIVP